MSRPAAGFAGYASLRLVGSDNPLIYIHIFMNIYVFVSPSHSSWSASERRERRVLYYDCCLHFACLCAAGLSCTSFSQNPSRA